MDEFTYLIILTYMILICYVSYLEGKRDGIKEEKERRKKMLIKALRQSVPKKRKNNV